MIYNVSKVINYCKKTNGFLIKVLQLTGCHKYKVLIQEHLQQKKSFKYNVTYLFFHLISKV